MCISWLNTCLLRKWKTFARLLQLILVTFIIFIILDDTSELRTLEVRFLNDPVNSSLFEEPESDHEQEHEPATRKGNCSQTPMQPKKRSTMRPLQGVNERTQNRLVQTCSHDPVSVIIRSIVIVRML